MSAPAGISRRLEGLVAVVTGAAQGLGFEIARQLALDGARTVLADLQFDKARTSADKLQADGLEAEAAVLDVTDSRQVDELFRHLVEEHGPLDILVNSAGLGQDVCPVVELTDDQWRRVFEVNMTGTFHTCRAAGRIMERCESGAIVNLASINGQNPAALVAAYNASKAAVISFTRTLALELAAYGVRVNAISPGPVYTDFNKNVMSQRAKSLDLSEQDMIERVRQAIPLARWGEPEDIASSVAFLCSSEASWITGQVLSVNGGLEGVSAAPPKRSG